MAVEGDEFIAVPDPPPPRPAARQAAIEAALQKFDGIDEAQLRTAPAARTGKWWATVHRRPAGALVAAALIAVVSVPVALITLRDEASNLAPPRSEPTAVQEDASTGARTAEPGPGTPSGGTSAADEQPSVTRRPAQSREVAAPTADRVPASIEQKAVEQGAPEPIAAAPPPPPPPPPPPAPAPSATAEEYADVAAEESIRVTGSRIPASNLEKQRSNRSAAQRTAESPGPVTVIDTYGEFLSRLQAAFRRNDRDAVLGLVALPLRVELDGRTVTYRSTKAIERDFAVIFTPEVRRSVLVQRPDALRSRGTRMGNGKIWFGPSRGSSIRIVEVNP